MDTNPVGPVHPGCMSVPAALAISETAKRSGADFLRAVTLEIRYRRPHCPGSWG